MSDDESSSGSRGRRSKVARLLDEHDLEGLGEDLERMWTAEEDRRSLRDLATHLNTVMLREHLAAAGIETLDGELENTYRLLTDDDVSTADRTRVERRLERQGLDVDGVRDDFVTYQAVRTYLKEYRDAEYEPPERDPLEREAENVGQLRGRVASVTEGKLEQLRSSGDISTGELRVLVETQVVCEDCNSQFSVQELLERGRCNCT